MSIIPTSHSAVTPLTVPQRESVLLAPYAMHSADSVGRRYAEPAHPYRGPFQRDRDRIVHSSAYRRLSYKTQVFTESMGDYHRTRLTHTLEVAGVARNLGRALRLNEDLIEALALAHDIGHPPFGHAGEDVLDECLADDGGFNHNRQALRIFEELETRYHDFPGLNLSLEVLEGQGCRACKGAAGPSPLLEVQVVDAGDSIAYDTHDADDALESGLLTLEELLELPLWHEAALRVRRRFAALSSDELRRAVLHELIDWQVSDLLQGVLTRLADEGIDSPAAVRAAEPVVYPSSDLAEKKAELEAFLHERVYRHPQVMIGRRQAQAALQMMFDAFAADPARLPVRFQDRIPQDGPRRATADYLAGLTDRAAWQVFQRHFDQ